MLRTFLTRRNIFILLGVLVLFFAGFQVYSVRAKNASLETVIVQKAEIKQVVAASGEIESDNEVNLKFPVSGKLDYLAVEKNDTVKKGQLVASLDTIQLSATYQQALNNYRNTQATVDNIHNQLKNNDSTETFSQRATRTTAETANDSAYDAVRSARDALANANLFSPISGVVTQVQTPAGTSEVGGTTTIVTIADPNKVFFVANVGEADIADVEVGQEAIVILDAFPDKMFHGRATEIDSAATITNGGKAYQVKIALDDVGKVKLDMSGDAEITTASHPNVLVIPRVAIQGTGDQLYVEVLEGKDIKKKNVTIGIKGTGGIVEALSGIGEGEKIIVPKP